METTDSGCSPARGRPRCPDKDAAILEAALTLLAHGGYARMTLDQVARRARVSKATVHLRWATKAELAAAALATLGPCSGPPPQGPTPARLAAVLREFGDMLTRTGGAALVGACLAEEAHTPELMTRLREHLIQPRLALLRSVLDEAARDGSLSPGADAGLLASALLGSLWADLLAGSTGSTGPDADAVVAAILPGVDRGTGTAPQPRDR